MALANWTEMTGSLSSGSVGRGVTAGVPRPPGGGNFLYGFNTFDASVGAVALYSNIADYAPMAKGGSIRGAVKRGLGGGNTNFSPFLFIGAQGGAVTDAAYIMGLSDENPSRIELRKGVISGGVPAGAPGSLGILAHSTATFPPDTWKHLRLDMIVNDNGDVVLNAYENDLTLHDVVSPVWIPIAGIAQPYVDDTLGINTGSSPFTSGRGGYGFVTQDVTRRAFFDQLHLYKQD